MLLKISFLGVKVGMKPIEQNYWECFFFNALS